MFFLESTVVYYRPDLCADELCYMCIHTKLVCIYVCGLPSPTCQYVASFEEHAPQAGLQTKTGDDSSPPKMVAHGDQLRLLLVIPYCIYQKTHMKRVHIHNAIQNVTVVYTAGHFWIIRVKTKGNKDTVIHPFVSSKHNLPLTNNLQTYYCFLFNTSSLYLA